MDQPIEEAGTERLCPYCHSWKVAPFIGDYYRCANEGCYRLIEKDELLVRKVNQPEGE